MDKFAYEFGKSLVKEANLGAVASGALSWAAKLGPKLWNYGRSLAPLTGKALGSAPGVATRATSKGIADTAKSVFGGLGHGITGGRFVPKGTVGKGAFNFGRSVGDWAYRHPYLSVIGGQASGLLPNDLANAFWWIKHPASTAGLELARYGINKMNQPPPSQMEQFGQNAYGALAGVANQGQQFVQQVPDYYSRVFNR